MRHFAITVRSCVAPLLIGAGASAQPPCVEDADGDAHPLFGSTFQRPSPEDLVFNQFVNPTDVAFGDVDDDGDPDAVVAQAAWNFLENELTYLTVLSNRGDGVFNPPVIYEAGLEVCGVELFDADGDETLDIAACNASENTVSILLNDGTGVFGSDAKHDVGQMPRSLVAEDFDGDGDADLAVLNVGSNDVSLLFSNGDGSFAPEVRVLLGSVTDRADPNLTFPVPGPFLASGDLDNDGDADLAIPSNGTVRIMVNDGAGGFSLSPEFVDLVGFAAYDIVIEDLDADGLGDLAVVLTQTEDTGVNVAMNEGGLSFADPVAYDVDFCALCLLCFLSIAGGDVDGDGDVDLVTGQDFHDGHALLRNHGDGSFAPMEYVESYPGPWVVELEDVSGDGWVELISLTTSPRAGLRVVLNDGAGSLLAPERVAIVGKKDGHSDHKELGAGDLNGDGHLDLVGVDYGSEVEIVEGHGDGSFTVHPDLVVDEDASFRGVAVGDLNGDGLDDVVLADDTATYDKPSPILTLLSTGDFDFELLPVHEIEDALGVYVDLGDLDADGDLDAAIGVTGFNEGHEVPVERSVLVMLNDGEGVLSPAGKTTFASFPFQIDCGVAIGDVDGDGINDVVAAGGPDEEPGVVAVMINDGAGGLTVTETHPVAKYPRSVGVGDPDGDGDLDFAVTSTPDVEPYLRVFGNDGTGSFAVMDEKVDENASTNGHTVFIDVDGDGHEDIVVAEVNGAVVVHLGRGDGTFQDPVKYGTLEVTRDFVVADFDGDGRKDIVAATEHHESMTLLRNRACAPCPADINADGELSILDFVAFQLLWQDQDPSADCDADGLFTVLDFVCFQQLFQAGC